MIALSTGGGMIEVVEIDGLPLSIKGDTHETLVWMEDAAQTACLGLADAFPAEEVLIRSAAGGVLMEIKSRTPLPENLAAGLGSLSGVRRLRRLEPVLPILSRRGAEVPYVTCAQMLAANAGERLDLGRLAARYESARGGISEPEVRRRMVAIVRILRDAVARGIQGTRFKDRILGWQSGGFKTAARRRPPARGRDAEHHDPPRHGPDGGQERHGRHRGRPHGRLLRRAAGGRGRRGRGHGLFRRSRRPTPCWRPA